MEKLIDFINENEKWEKILSGAPYNLRISTDGDYKLLKYSQIESDFGFDLVCQSRGCIIRYENGFWDYVCRPFDKFFNAGEQYAATIDWNSKELSVTEKIDGSLHKVWYDHGWHISTNGTIDASKAETGCILSEYDNYYKLFFAAVLKYYGSLDEFYSTLDMFATNMFELVSPYNRVVIPYDDVDLYYLGSRNTQTGDYFYLNVKCKEPKSILVKSLEELVGICSDMEWTKEGFVVFDGINRIKCKSPAYVRAHYMRNNGVVTYEKLLEVVLSGETEEFKVYAPEYRMMLDEMIDRLFYCDSESFALIHDMKGFFGIPRKEYALKVKEKPSKWSAFLFKLYDNHDLSFHDWFAEMSLKKKVKFLDYD